MNFNGIDRGASHGMIAWLWIDRAMDRNDCEKNMQRQSRYIVAAAKPLYSYSGKAAISLQRLSRYIVAAAEQQKNIDSSQRLSRYMAVAAKPLYNCSG